MPEPPFQLILDQDILIDHEIDDAYSFNFAATNTFMLRMEKEGGMNILDRGSFGQPVLMGGAGVIGELPGSERVVTSGGEETSVIDGVEGDLESDASSQ